MSRELEPGSQVPSMERAGNSSGLTNQDLALSYGPTPCDMTGNGSTGFREVFQIRHQVPVYRDSAYIIAICILLAVFILTTVIGNTFVLVAIKVERTLHNSSYYLIMSLAVTDLTVALLAMPFGIVDEISQVWFLGRTLCEVWITFDVVCCTASILHLMFISFDRYWAVTNVAYVTSNKKTRIAGLIILSWVVALVVAVSPQFGWKDPRNNPEYTGNCLIAQSQSYTIFSTLCAFYIPAIIMIIMYIKIYKVAKAAIRKEKFRQRELEKTAKRETGIISQMWRDEWNNSSQRDAKMARSNSMDNNNTARQNETQTSMQTGMYLEVPENPRLSSSLDNLSDSKEIEMTEKPKPVVSMDNLDVLRGDKERSVRLTMNHSQSYTSSFRPKSNEMPRTFQLFSRLPRYATASELTNKYIYEDSVRNRASKSVNDIANARRHKARIESRKQRKVAITLAIITGAFIACWLPFFVVALVAPLVTSFRIPRVVKSCVLWLGYFNSMINPILYTIFSPDFRKAFRKIKIILTKQKHVF